MKKAEQSMTSGITGRNDSNEPSNQVLWVARKLQHIIFRTGICTGYSTGKDDAASRERASTRQLPWHIRKLRRARTLGTCRGHVYSYVDIHVDMHVISLKYS